MEQGVLKKKCLHRKHVKFELAPYVNLFFKASSWGLNASIESIIDTHINGQDQIWCHCQMWPYCHYDHIRDMALVVIDAINQPDHWYGLQKKRLELRIAAGEVSFA